MAASFDAGTQLDSSGYVNSLTISHAASGTDQLVLLTVACRQMSNVTGATHDGNAMVNEEESIGENICAARVYSRVAPGTGSKDVVVSLDAYRLVSAYVASYTSVDQTTPIEATAVADAYNTSLSTTITTVSANALIQNSINLQNDYALTPDDGTERNDTGHSDANLGQLGVLTKTTTTAGSYSSGWSWSSSDNSHMVLVAIKGASASTTPVTVSVTVDNIVVNNPSPTITTAVTIAVSVDAISVTNPDVSVSVAVTIPVSVDVITINNGSVTVLTSSTTPVTVSVSVDSINIINPNVSIRSHTELNEYRKKQYYYKIYSSGEFVTTWIDDVISKPEFRYSINGGVGELVIKLARSFSSFGENEDVKLNNLVHLYCHDKDNPDGILLYKGRISGYRPILREREEYLEVTVLGLVEELSRFMLRGSGGETTITYTNKDPGYIIKDILSKYRADGGIINYDDTTISLTGTTVSYTFNTHTVRDAIDKVVDLSPAGWFWRVDSNGYLYFQDKSTTADHKFTIGREIKEMSPWRKTEGIYNRVYFMGGGDPQLYLVASRTSSIADYGLSVYKMIDQRVTSQATAEIMISRFLDERESPEIRTVLTIIDNNGVNNEKGYDIESIKPGDTLQIINLQFGSKSYSYWDSAIFDVDVWDYTLAFAAASVIQIMAVNYTDQVVTVEASSKLPDMARRIEEVNELGESIIEINNPSTPTSV